MTEPESPRGDDQSEQNEDQLRRHSEENAEGSDTPETGTGDVPREHAEDPAEG